MGWGGGRGGEKSKQANSGDFEHFSAFHFWRSSSSFVLTNSLSPPEPPAFCRCSWSLPVVRGSEVFYLSPVHLSRPETGGKVSLRAAPPPSFRCHSSRLVLVLLLSCCASRAKDLAFVWKETIPLARQNIKPATTATPSEPLRSGWVGVLVGEGVDCCAAGRRRVSPRRRPFLRAPLRSPSPGRSRSLDWARGWLGRRALANRCLPARWERRNAHSRGVAVFG